MIREITVENLAIIDRCVLSLDAGFTVLTGETGAGKSLVVDSIELALGSRADSDLVRTGAPRATVSVRVDASGQPGIREKLAALGATLDGEEFVIAREVSAEGRSSVRVNGRVVSVTALRELGQMMVDLHGQHDHQALLHQERQIEFLDLWIGESVRELVPRVAAAFEESESLRRRLQHIRTHRREREQRLDMLRHQEVEIREAGLRDGELEEIKQSMTRLRHAERIGLSVSTGLGRLQDDESSIREQLAVVLRDLDQVVTFDPSLENRLSRLREALYSLDEGTHELRAYSDTLEMEPERLQILGDRHDQIVGLLRKYGETEEEVLAHWQRIAEEIDALADPSISEEDLECQLQEAQAKLTALADELTALRTGRSIEFAAEVQGHARELAMENADFSVRFDRADIGPNGQDRVEFFFSANPGELSRPLAKVASGGELSRLMLAIKVASAGRAGVPTLVFDEVDTGLSGRAAAVTARKIRELSRFRQVVVISHLPQIAGQADRHYRIEKQQVDGRVRTELIELGGDDRVSEIARLLAGEEVGPSALANARELLSKS